MSFEASCGRWSGMLRQLIEIVDCVLGAYGDAVCVFMG